MAVRNSSKVVSKFRSSTVVDFAIVYPSGETRLIARVEFPADGQLGDSVETSRQIAEILNRRIKKSVP